jgi:GT2 family glycosyltransferase
VSTTTQHPSRIGIVLVNLNGYDDTSVCLDSLASITYPNVEIIVVDNGSKDRSGDRLKREYPNVTHIRSEQNLGFTGGNNLGIDHAMSHGCDHVVLLNNDTIVTPDFLQPLVERLESAPDIGAVSGKIYYAPQALGGKKNVIWYAGAFQKWHTGYHHDGVLEVDSGKFDTARDVAYASGCLMLMRGEVIRKIGGLADDFFIYWEEADWCRRAWALGYRSVYEPKSVIYHNFKSAPVGHETPFHMYMQYRNAFIYAHRHYRGLERVRYWLFYPVYILYRVLLDVRAKNWKAARATFWGVLDYFRGFTGTKGLRERGFLKA